MMCSTAKLTIFCALIVSSYATPIFEPIFAPFEDDFQSETNIVKREVEPEKLVSLQSLIGGLENSLLRSAQSVSSITNSKNAVLPEVTPPAVEENHSHKKRHTEQTETTEANQKVTSTETPPEVKRLLLQTTEKVPLKEGTPAHILIDRVTVQDFNGGLPIIPPFEVRHTKVVSATISAGNSTEISITKTSTTSTSTLVGSSTVSPATTSSVTARSSTEHSTVPPTGSTSTTKANSDSSSTSQATTGTTSLITGSSTEHSTIPAIGSTSTVTANTESSSSTQVTTEKTTISADNKSTTTETTSTTTKTPMVKLKEAEKELKEAEQDLKEKVAEIEADPIILSSRI